MITPALPSNLANFVAPFSPVGKLAVGEENPEARNTPFKPVEESSQPARQENRASTAERAALAEERVEFPQQPDPDQQDDAQQRQRQQSRASTEQQQEQEQEEQRVIAQLAQRDREVRAHEQAHTAVGGTLAGSPVYRFQRGPDGVSYAVSGEVSISTGQVAGNPEATLQNSRRVRQAALAPADPSPQDRQVAVEAARIEQQAIQDIVNQAADERQQRADELTVQREARAQVREEEQQRLEEQRLEAQRRENVTTEDQLGLRQQAEFSESFVDINRRLIDIGAIDSPRPVGGLLDLSA